MSRTPPAGELTHAPSIDPPPQSSGSPRLPHASELPSIVHGPLPQLFRCAVDLSESLEDADPKRTARLSPQLRLDQSLDAFSRVLNPQGLPFWGEHPRDGWLGCIRTASDLDRDGRAVFAALCDSMTDVNGALDCFRRWWDSTCSAEPTLEDLLAWEYLRRRLWLAVAGLWAIMGEAERQTVPAGSVRRMLAVTGWKELPDNIPQALRRRGSRTVDLDQRKTRRLAADPLLIAGTGEAVAPQGEWENQPDETPEADTPPTKPPKQKLTQDQTNALVANWFRRHQEDKPERITRDRITAETGASKGAVSKSPMWIAFAAKKKATATPTERTVPLTDTLLAIIPTDKDTPGGLAALIEEHAADDAEDRRRHDLL
jgi:hypothetical protein